MKSLAHATEIIGAILALVCGALLLFKIAEIPALVGLVLSILFVGFVQRQKKKGGDSASPDGIRQYLNATIITVCAVGGIFFLLPQLANASSTVLSIACVLYVTIFGGLIFFFLRKALQPERQKD